MSSQPHSNHLKVYQSIKISRHNLLSHLRFLIMVDDYGLMLFRAWVPSDLNVIEISTIIIIHCLCFLFKFIQKAYFMDIAWLSMYFSSFSYCVFQTRRKQRNWHRDDTLLKRWTLAYEVCRIATKSPDSVSLMKCCLIVSWRLVGVMCDIAPNACPRRHHHTKSIMQTCLVSRVNCLWTSPCTSYYFTFPLECHYTPM